MRETTLTAAVALDAIEEGIVVQDAGDNVVYANRAASELLGIDRHKLRAGSELPEPTECLSDDGETFGRDGWPGPEALRSGRPQRPRVLRIKRPDGGVRWLRASARPIGRSVLTSLQDVTALRRAEEDAAALASRLTGSGSSSSVLSPREHQVVELLAAGLTGEQVAARLGISPATVRVHIRNATGKLGASTRTQAVAIAVARGEVAAP
ncbi:MAG TPA: LuxR C-terminal-related transcriptional regulator [Solirubrobacteraceae bacterium]